MKVSICIILYKTKYLDETLQSLIDQSYEDIELLFLDQEEGVWSAATYVQKNFPTLNVTKGKNLWHSGGMNKLAGMAKGDLVLIASNDIFYPKDFVSNIVKEVAELKDESFCPILKRWDYPEKLTNDIDCVGINVDRKLHFSEVLSGQEYDEDLVPDYVDGPNGALAIVRRSVLERFLEKDGYLFDEKIHYKNDCDLTFRFKKAGLRTKVLRSVVAYHDRQAVFYKKKSRALRESSFYGDCWILWKHFSLRFDDFNPIKVCFYYTFKILYLLIRYPYLWKVLNKVLREIKKD